MSDQSPDLEQLKNERDAWREDARRYSANADYWRNRAEKNKHRFSERSHRPPEILKDPDDEGIYLLVDPWRYERTAMFPLSIDDRLKILDLRGWTRQEYVWMKPSADGETWEPAPRARGRAHPGWRLNLPLRWRPVAYAYCTPPVEKS